MTCSLTAAILAADGSGVSEYRPISSREKEPIDVRLARNEVENPLGISDPLEVAIQLIAGAGIRENVLHQRVDRSKLGFKNCGTAAAGRFESHAGQSAPARQRNGAEPALPRPD
jgi:hypothetical protein